MAQDRDISPARRKRLLKTYGSCPVGYTNEDLERFLDLLYPRDTQRETSKRAEK